MTVLKRWEQRRRLFHERAKALHYIGEAIRFQQSVALIRAEPLMKELTEDAVFQQLVKATQDDTEQQSGSE